MNKASWVFGYGSLLWNPGFNPAEMVKARLKGYSRTFCMHSVTYRGTEEFPGLVLGLDADDNAECRGLAMRIPDAQHDQIIAYLRARELVTSAYDELILPLELEDGREVEAFAYVMRRDHHQYAGGLGIEEQARIIARAHGGNGPNSDYLFNTTKHLAELGLPDTILEDLSDQVRSLMNHRE